MKIKDVLQRDPAEHKLANNGQARIVNTDDARALEELRYELSTFVCEGQYADGIQKILSSFLGDLGKTSQRASWVSGFFGSGKSHLLKMLCHLWEDTTFPDGSTARSLVPSIPDDLHALLRELDVAGKRTGGLISAAGTLLGGTKDAVRLTILGIIFNGVGLPTQYPMARFCLWLKEQGYYDQVKASVEATGKDFRAELPNLYVSPAIADAVLAVDPNFATDQKEARKTLRETYPQIAGDITTEDFVRNAKRALKLAGKDGKLPCTVLILDEAQQYIGDSTDSSSVFTEVAEALCKQFDSQVMVVAAGQSALTAMPNLQKMFDRFTIRVPLSDVEVETVTRKVLLQKKPSTRTDVKSMLETHAGEVSRQLQGTRIAERAEDKYVMVEDYPLLPVRRRFWEQCFRQIDAEGNQSQLRSQLQIIHDCVARRSSRDLGTVVPANELYDALAPEMINTGVLLREIHELIIRIGEEYGPQARAVCGLVFLIGKVRRDDASDIGVRSSKDHIADLLVEELHGDNGKLRNEVGAMLEKLADDGKLLRVGEEYRLQTREGSEWDREFKNRQTKLRNDESNLQFRRDQLLYAAFDKTARNVKLLHGASKLPRHLAISRDQTPPQSDDQSIVTWVRDGFTSSEKDHQNAARSAGSDSAVLFVHIPRKSADDLRRLIVEADAAEQTLHARGNPTAPEGQEARSAMESRFKLAQQQRDELVNEIVGQARVFQGGGSEVLSIELHDKLRDAAEASLVRLFPRFKEADSGAWGAVLKRVKERADHPFQPLQHNDLIEKHAVCAQVLSTIGAGKSGSDIRAKLEKSPFGWPRDGIDAALMALHNAQHINATLNGNTLNPGELDQNKISKAEFHCEHVTLTIQDKLRIRKLYKALNIPCNTGEENERATDFLVTLLNVAREAGGDPPLPPHPNLAPWQDIQALHGNERLLALKDQAETIEQSIKEWTDLGILRVKRLPSWALANRLVRQGDSVAGVEAHVEQMNAIRDQRLLLDNSDPIAPVLKALADLLRKTVNELHAQQVQRHQEGLDELAANDTWQKLSEADRDALLQEVGLRMPSTPSIGSDEALANYLETHTLESMRSTIDAIPGRVSQALQRAAKKLEPKVQTVRVDRATLRSAEEVEAWIDKQKKRLLDALGSGPVLID